MRLPVRAELARALTRASHHTRWHRTVRITSARTVADPM